MTGGGELLRKAGCSVRNILSACALGVLILPAAAIVMADRLIFHPPQTLEAPPEERVTVLPDNDFTCRPRRHRMR